MLGTALTLGGIGKAMDFGFDLLGGYLGGQMSTANSKELLKKQFKYQKELMRIQNDYNVYNYQHQHQWRVGDLRSAGLNPILSASGGTAVAPVSNPGVSSGSSSNALTRDNSMTHLLRDVVQLNSAKVKSEIKYNEAAAADRLSAATLNAAKTKYEDAKGDTAKGVKSFYDSLQSGSEALGRRLGQWMLNSSLAERAVNFTGMPLTNNPDAWSAWRKAQVRKARTTYDPERKVFIHHGGK